MKLDNFPIAGSLCFTPIRVMMHAKLNQDKLVKPKWPFTYSFTFSLFISLFGKLKLDHRAGSSCFTPRLVMMYAKPNQDE